MIDLYGIQSGFPGLEEAEKFRPKPQKRVEFLEQSFFEDIGDPRFVPYIQLHEYEAYLFSDPSWFSYFYDHHETKIAQLKAIAEGYATPELIDDGPHSTPSKRIIAALPDYEGAKSVVGPQVAELIGLGIIREKCPHFSEWLSKIERLGGKRTDD